MHDQFNIRVAGVSFRQDAVLATNTGDTCELLPEPTNPHDPHAIRVINTKLEDGFLGYVPKEQNQAIEDAIAMGCVITALVESTARPEGSQHRGVWLRLEVHYPDLFK